jgi:hypothetical protein
LANNSSPAFLCIAIVTLVLTPLQLFLGEFSVRHESGYGQALAISIFVANIVFIILQLIEMQESPDVDFFVLTGRTTAYACLAITLLVGTIVIAGICTTNYNRGLKPHLQQRRVPADAGENNAQLYEAHARSSRHVELLSSRMDIDQGEVDT